jgi:predicted ferric reductase
MCLISFIAVTAVLPLFFVPFHPDNLKLNVYLILAKAGALSGTILIVWQFLLGFRQVLGKIIEDLLWVFKVHKEVGTYILFLVVLHPICITLYYIEVEGFNPLLLGGSGRFNFYAILGVAAILIFLAVVVTSVFLRAVLGKRRWFMFHMSTYVALPLVLVHSWAIGRTVGNTFVGKIWWVVTAVVAVFVVFRVACRFGLLCRKHVVRGVEEVGPNVVKITSRPVGKKIEPKLGQFVYFRHGLWGCVRPFTVSHYDKESGEISVTVKAIGKTTGNLQNTQAGDTVYIDGPYGVFSRTALQSDKPIVMVAGGIGITPFTQLFEELAYEPDREVHLFYGNRNKQEIVYKEEFENADHVNTVHVLSEEDDYEMETGFVRTELISKYVGDLRRYEFLICGPPPMITKLEAALLEAGVPDEQIHHELFGY